MFCNQCEQTAKGTGCTKIGVCGKQPEVAALQDLLIYALQGLSQVAVQARAKSVSDPETNRFVNEGVFSTLTNVDFDPARFQVLIRTPWPGARPSRPGPPSMSIPPLPPLFRPPPWKT